MVVGLAGFGPPDQHPDGGERESPPPKCRSIVSSLQISHLQLILLEALFALADAIRADEIVGPSRVDAALLGHPRQHLAIGRAGVPGARSRAEAQLWRVPGPGQHGAQLNNDA